jgi:hypothetical protein
MKAKLEITHNHHKVVIRFSRNIKEVHLTKGGAIKMMQALKRMINDIEMN